MRFVGHDAEPSNDKRVRRSLYGPETSLSPYLPKSRST